MDEFELGTEFAALDDEEPETDLPDEEELEEGEDDEEVDADEEEAL